MEKQENLQSRGTPPPMAKCHHSVNTQDWTPFPFPLSSSFLRIARILTEMRFLSRKEQSGSVRIVRLHCGNTWSQKSLELKPRLYFLIILQVHHKKKYKGDAHFIHSGTKADGAVTIVNTNHHSGRSWERLLHWQLNPLVQKWPTSLLATTCGPQLISWPTQTKRSLRHHPTMYL